MLRGLVQLLLLVALLLVASCEAFWQPRKPEDDLYGVLGIKRHATEHEVKKAFRKRTKEHHPDLKETAEEKEVAKEKMAHILRAYEVLSDTQKRRDFDAFGKIGDAPGGGGGGGGHGHSHHDPFFFFHQQQQQQQHVDPIKSKAPKLTAREFRTTVLPHRGPRIAVIQFYHDQCHECRMFASVWETFVTKHPLGLALDVYRCNMMDPESGGIAEELYVTYGFGNAPAVAVVVDGTGFLNTALTGALFSGRPETMLPALTAFVESFYVDVVADLPFDRAMGVMALALWLTEDRAGGDDSSSSGGHPPRMVLSNNMDPMLLVAARVEAGDDLIVRSSGLQAMRELCHQCKFPGSAVNALELAIVANKSFHGRDLLSAEWCSHLSLATTSSKFLPKRLLKFVEDSAVAEEADAAASDPASSARDKEKKTVEQNLPFLTAKTVEPLCINKCAIWVHFCQHGQRGNAPDPTEDLLDDLAPFAKARVCQADVPSGLFDKLGVRNAVTSPHMSLLIVVIKADVFVQQYGRGTHVANVLADAMEGSLRPVPAAKGRQGQAQQHAGWFGTLYTTLSKQQAPNTAASMSTGGGQQQPHQPPAPRFPVRRWRWYGWVAAKAYSSIPFGSLLPLVVVYYAVKWMQGALSGGPAAAAASKRDAASAKAKPGRAPSPPVARPTPSPQRQTAGTAGGGSVPRHSSGASSVPQFNQKPSATAASVVLSKADLQETETGKGYLVLLFDRRCLRSAATEFVHTLPPELAVGDGGSMSSFSGRCVAVRHGRIWKWLDSLLASAGAPPSQTDYIAIRKTKMLCAIKPAHQPLQSWLLDLKDGSVVPTISIDTLHEITD